MMKVHAQIFLRLTVTASLVIFGIPAAAQTTEASNKDKVLALLNSFNTGEQAPIGYINPSKYIQHNLGVADGLAGFGAIMKNAPEGGFKASVVRSFQDGDYVFTQTEYDFFGPKAGFDIFRFEGGKIVEHWDNLSAIMPPNPSGRTQFDGSTEIVDRNKTQANKLVVENLLNEVFIGGQLQNVSQYISTEKYIQHNSFVADGLNGLAAALNDPNSPKIVCQKLHKVLGEGNFVLSVSEGTYAGAPASFYDLFRLENGKVVEHWDVIEKILPDEKRKNKNGKFGLNGVVEVTTFRAKPEVDAAAFQMRDKQIANDFTNKQPGFIRRQSGVNEKGEYVVVVYWTSLMDADASMKKFMGDGSVADYAQMIDGPTMKMARFSADQGFIAEKSQFVEVMSFDLKSDTDMAKFDVLNRKVETEFTGKRDGFLQRLTGVDESGKQVVAVYWSSKETSDASLQPFMNAPVAKEFMQYMDPSSVVMGRYELLHQ